MLYRLSWFVPFYAEKTVPNYFRLILLVSMAIYLPANAQETDNTLAATFAYSAKNSGQELATGYKKHLEWHVANNDPILWYAWFVIQGDRLGHFIDGAYDVTGAEFDARPDPAGDGADARANFAPFVNLEYRRIFRLRRDLSTSTFLEDRNPSPLMQVVYYRVKPGGQLDFEAAATAIAAAAIAMEIKYTVYELLTGATGALYALYVPLTGISSFDTDSTSLETIARRTLDGPQLEAAMQFISAVTQETVAEVWQYRADLSLIPEID